MRFIRKNGRVIPIKEKGEKNKTQKMVPAEIVATPNSRISAAKEGAKFGLKSGAALGAVGGAIFGASRAVGGSIAEWGRMVPAGAAIGAAVGIASFVPASTVLSALSPGYTLKLRKKKK